MEGEQRQQRDIRWNQSGMEQLRSTYTSRTLAIGSDEIDSLKRKKTGRSESERRGIL